VFRRAATASFLNHGRNRKPRLAVVDVTAVDSRRRLVLVRRDDCEHLILIGGPSDLVVESGIRKRAEERRIAPEFSEPMTGKPRAAAPAIAAEPASSAAPEPVAAQEPAPMFTPEPVAEAAPEPEPVPMVLPVPAPEPVIERKQSLLDPQIGPAIRQ